MPDGQPEIRNPKSAIGLWRVILIGFLFALPSLDDGLVSDDYDLIAESRIASVQDVEQALTEPGLKGFFRPLPRLMLGLNWAVGGLHPFGYHLVNAIVHIGSALVLYRVLAGLVPSSPVSHVAALLFAGHFVHVEPVYWVAARNELLAAFFFLAALWWALRPDGRPGRRGLALAGFIAALLSKETAVTFPLVIAGAAFEQTSGTAVDRLRRALKACAPYTALLLFYSLIRLQVGAAWPWNSREIGFSVRPDLLVRNVEHYALQMVVPVRTILDLRGPETYAALTETVRSRADDPRLLTALVVGAVLLVAAGKVALSIGGRPARLGIAFAGLTALPFLMMEGTGLRYLYLPSAGCAVAAAGVLCGIAHRVQDRRTGDRVLAWTTAILIACSLAAAGEQSRWWGRAGQECQAVIRAVARRSAGLPPDVPLEVLQIPRRIHGAYVFHNGFAAAMHLSGLDATRRIVDGDRARERGERIPPEAWVYWYSKGW